MERVVLIDYGSGNLRSAAKALERVSAEAGLNQAIEISASPKAVDKADRVVLPGVGAFGQCALALRGIDGMEDALNRHARERRRPFLGICVGMQLLARRGQELGTHLGLGWIPGEVVRLKPHNPAYKVPQMGWNKVRYTPSGADHVLLHGLAPGQHAYFVHSFHLLPENQRHVLATVDYSQTVTAIVGDGNIVGTQFHPEKSQEFGLAFLTEFLKWRP